MSWLPSLVLTNAFYQMQCGVYTGCEASLQGPWNHRVWVLLERCPIPNPPHTIPGSWTSELGRTLRAIGPKAQNPLPSLPRRHHLASAEHSQERGLIPPRGLPAADLMWAPQTVFCAQLLHSHNCPRDFAEASPSSPQRHSSLSSVQGHQDP